jgi:hypothetical protein
MKVLGGSGKRMGDTFSWVWILSGAWTLGATAALDSSLLIVVAAAAVGAFMGASISWAHKAMFEVEYWTAGIGVIIGAPLGFFLTLGTFGYDAGLFALVMIPVGAWAGGLVGAHFSGSRRSPYAGSMVEERVPLVPPSKPSWSHPLARADRRQR